VARKRNNWAAALFLLAVMAVSPPSIGADTVTVSAAVSLRDVLNEVWGPDVILNAAGSGTLLRQILQGAPVDLFISASPDELDQLEKAGLLVPGSRTTVATNRLVTILAPSGRHPDQFRDLTGPEIARVAIGNPRTVPAGRYAREALLSAGLWEPLQDRLVYAENVRQVVEYVARGDADAGLVYRTDAELFRGRVVIGPGPPERSYTPILYQAAILKEATAQKAAVELLELLLAEQGRQTLMEYGFTIPAKSP